MATKTKKEKVKFDYFFHGLALLVLIVAFRSFAAAINRIFIAFDYHNVLGLDLTESQRIVSSIILAFPLAVYQYLLSLEILFLGSKKIPIFSISSFYRRLNAFAKSVMLVASGFVLGLLIGGGIGNCLRASSIGSYCYDFPVIQSPKQILISGIWGAILAPTVFLLMKWFFKSQSK